MAIRWAGVCIVCPCATLLRARGRRPLLRRGDRQSLCQRGSTGTALRSLEETTRGKLYGMAYGVEGVLRRCKDRVHAHEIAGVLVQMQGAMPHLAAPEAVLGRSAL